MKPYEEVCFPSGIIRWIREGDEYVCRLTEDQINEIKEIHEEPWVKTYSGGKPNYTQPIEREPILPGGGGGSGEPTIDGWPLYSGLPQPEPERYTTDAVKVRQAVSEAVLQQSEQGPIAYLCENAVGHKYFRWKKPPSTYKPIALYTEHASPQLIWQGLTDEEVVARANAEVFAEAFARGVAWAELKLKEKNNG